MLGRRRGVGLPAHRYSSLGVRFVALMVAVELAFGLLLALVVGLFALRAAAAEREDTVRDIAGVVAASIMPVVADQNAAAIDAQLQGIMAVGRAHKITRIYIEDDSGVVIAQARSVDESDAEPVHPLLAAVVGPASVTHPVSIGGLEVARVTVDFAPEGISRVFDVPWSAALIVIGTVAFVSVPWSAWIMLRTVVEPLRDLRDGATRVARGDRDIELHDGTRADEIGELAATLDWMAQELDDKQQRLLASVRSLESAYESESRMKHEIEQLMKVKSDFVAVASHELRNPLAVLSLYAEMLDTGAYGTLDPDVARAVASMLSAAARLNSIVSNLMDAALLERGLMPMTLVETRIDALVEQSAIDGAVLAHGRGVTVVAEPMRRAVLVTGDPVRLRQVLDNLISNAVKYSPAGGRVTVALWTTDGAAVVRVSDEGKGIDPADRDRLFRLFAKLGDADDSESAGLGLGLAISARIIEAHGGRLRADDGPEGRGTSFIFSVPLAGVAEAPVHAEVPLE